MICVSGEQIQIFQIFSFTKFNSFNSIQSFHFLPLENIKKPLVFWFFRGHHTEMGKLARNGQKKLTDIILIYPLSHILQ